MQFSRIDVRCFGKRAYASVHAAHEFERKRQRHAHKYKPCDIYRCPTCNQWHLGRRS